MGVLFVGTGRMAKDITVSQNGSMAAEITRGKPIWQERLSVINEMHKKRPPDNLPEAVMDFLTA